MPPVVPTASAGDGRLLRFAAWMLGFVMLCSPYLIPGADEAPRATDALAGVLVGAGALALLKGRSLRVDTLARLLPVAIVVPLWVLHDHLVFGELPGAVAARWLLAVPYAYALRECARRDDTRTALGLGIFWGAVANLGVVALQKAGYADLAVTLGLSSPRFKMWWAAVGNTISVRPTGMWGHPNAASGVTAIGFPIICGLIDEGRVRARWMVPALALVAVSSQMTLTRSGLVISALVFLAWLLTRPGTLRQRASAVGALGLTALVVIIVGPPGGWERWTDSGSATNASERGQATVEAFSLMLTNPLGLGVDYAATLMDRVGIPATHNAWMALGLTAGLPLVLVALVPLVTHAVMLLRRRRIEGWLALQLLGLFMFEEYFRLSPVIIAVLWLVATPRPARVADRSAVLLPSRLTPASASAP